MDTINLRIEGMTCMGCVASVTRLLQAQPGVKDANVTLTPGAASVNYDAGKVSEASLKATLKVALEDAGYEATVA
jgi:copper chaperone